MTTDEWLTAALTDDTVVVELLFRLKQSSESYLSVAAKPLPLPPPLLRWGSQQPRSKPAARKGREPTRFSPTTPLSWSGGTASLSDGYDESSLPFNRSSTNRSKGVLAKETTINKRSRRKKTFAELKEEEVLLSKERMHLKKQLETLRLTLRDQRARSEELKRIKLDLHLQSANKIVSASDTKPNPLEVSSLDYDPLLSTHARYEDLPAPDSWKVESNINTQEGCFTLPDLNVAPSEVDCGSETL